MFCVKSHKKVTLEEKFASKARKRGLWKNFSKPRERGGSTAERAGFLAGDEVVSLNGRPIAEYAQGSLGGLIGGSEPLRWEVKRGDEVVVIEIN